PDEVHEYGRPKSSIPTQLRRLGQVLISRRRAAQLQSAPDLFEDFNAQAHVFEYHNDFRRQLKARLIIMWGWCSNGCRSDFKKETHAVRRRCSCHPVKASSSRGPWVPGTRTTRRSFTCQRANRRPSSISCLTNIAVSTKGTTPRSYFSIV